MLTFTVFLCMDAHTQDIHFSSTGFNPMFFNPSMTAVMNNKFRASTIYRNQWQSVSKGYNTFFGGFEFQPWTSFNGTKGLGFGIGFTNDVAGSLSFGERDISVAISYFMALDWYAKSYLSIGVQGMKKNWSMNLVNAEFNREMTYDDNIRYESLNTYDISVGIAYQYARDEQHLFHIGAAYFHINTPSLSFFADEGIYMHKRFFANTSYMFPLSDNDHICFNPQIFFQHQHKFTEVLIGGDAIVDIDRAIFTHKILSLGLYLRNTDAIVIAPKFRFNDFVMGIAYDVNISGLHKVSATYGAFEIWLSYSFNPFYYKQKTTKIPCPIF